MEHREDVDRSGGGLEKRRAGPQRWKNRPSGPDPTRHTVGRHH